MKLAHYASSLLSLGKSRKSNNNRISAGVRRNREVSRDGSMADLPLGFTDSNRLAQLDRNTGEIIKYMRGYVKYC